MPLTKQRKGFNQIILYGKDVAVTDLLTQARRFPMMSERQTVIVKEAQDIKDLQKEESQKMLEDYLSQPQTSTILVLAHKHKAFDKRKKLWKTLSKHAEVVESKKLYDNQLPDWIKKYVSAQGHMIGDKASHMLAENIGANLQRLTNEIEKVLINFKERTEITPELIDKYVGISKDYNSFELQRAIAQHDVLKAVKITNYFGDNPKTNPILPILAVLFSFFSKLLIVHQNSGANDKVLASKLKVNPFFIREYLSASKYYSVSKVVSNIGHIRTADLSAKGVNTGNIDQGELLKELVFKLMH